MAVFFGKTAIVTGASKGIGKAIALALGTQGANVVVNYMSSETQAREVADQIQQHGSKALAYKANVGDMHAIQEMVAATAETFGQIDILVNNAGITRDKTLKKMDIESWQAVINTNLNSVFYCTSAVLPHMLRTGRGRIINISSAIAQTGAIGQANYAAAKAGMLGFTKAAALELAKAGITVNSVCPGYIETDMFAHVPEEVKDKIKAHIPQGRLGNAEEVARVVLFLADEEQTYITGQSFSINGGLFMQ